MLTAPLAMLVDAASFLCSAVVIARLDVPDRPLEQAGGAERIEQVGQRLLDGGGGDRRLQQPEPGERLDRAAAARRTQAREGLVAGQGRVRRRSEGRGHAVVGEAGSGQRPTQALRQLLVAPVQAPSTNISDPKGDVSPPAPSAGGRRTPRLVGRALRPPTWRRRAPDMPPTGHSCTRGACRRARSASYG